MTKVIKYMKKKRVRFKSILVNQCSEGKVRDWYAKGWVLKLKKYLIVRDDKNAKKSILFKAIY